MKLFQKKTLICLLFFCLAFSSGKALAIPPVVINYAVSVAIHLAGIIYLTWFTDNPEPVQEQVVIVYLPMTLEQSQKAGSQAGAGGCPSGMYVGANGKCYLSELQGKKGVAKNSDGSYNTNAAEDSGGAVSLGAKVEINKSVKGDFGSGSAKAQVDAVGQTTISESYANLAVKKVNGGETTGTLKVDRQHGTDGNQKSSSLTATYSDSSEPQQGDKVGTYTVGARQGLGADGCGGPGLPSCGVSGNASGGLGRGGCGGVGQLPCAISGDGLSSGGGGGGGGMVNCGGPGQPVCEIGAGGSGDGYAIGVGTGTGGFNGSGLDGEIGNAKVGYGLAVKKLQETLDRHSKASLLNNGGGSLPCWEPLSMFGSNLIICLSNFQGAFYAFASFFLFGACVKAFLIIFGV